MSSNSLIFSMGAISMKVNPVFVSILIIASLLAIHLSTYIQPLHRLWDVLNWAPIMALTPSPEVSSPVVMGRSDLRLISWPLHLLLRCLRLLSWDGLNLDSYHGPHTFSWGVSACRHETVWTWTHIMVLTPSPEVSPPVVMRRSDLGLISWSSHLPSEVSPPIVMKRSEHGLISWSSHLPSEVSLSVIMKRSVLGLTSWPTHLL